MGYTISSSCEPNGSGELKKYFNSHLSSRFQILMQNTLLPINGCFMTIEKEAKVYLPRYSGASCSKHR